MKRLRYNSIRAAVFEENERINERRTVTGNAVGTKTFVRRASVTHLNWEGCSGVGGSTEQTHRSRVGVSSGGGGRANERTPELNHRVFVCVLFNVFAEIKEVRYYSSTLFGHHQIYQGRNCSWYQIDYTITVHSTRLAANFQIFPPIFILL